ncbi:MAG: YqeG family HAD IIIA-type phosphatase [Lachnospiraceae bacterium]|nr:YqeG family HAD IIIA-type phosphatase [Lachnospiraceae bacterium]
MRVFRPRQYRRSIYEIDYAALRRWGFKAVFLDVDNTILPFDESEVSDEALHLIDYLKELGFKIWILSNGKEERVKHITSQLGIYGIWKAGKPFLTRFRKKRREAGLKRRECIVIGDQIFTDVLMANLEGAYSILVQPISLVRDEAITKIKRPLEKKLIESMQLKVKDLKNALPVGNSGKRKNQETREKNS